MIDMKIFADTADIEEIRKLNDFELIDGVTTNPSLIAKSGKDFKHTIIEICNMVNGPVSAEVISTDYSNIVKEAMVLAALHKNVVVKLPLTIDGLKAAKYCSQHDIKTNVTLCFSVSQALLAAKSGATYISPFVGRLDDKGEDGMKLVECILTVYKNYSYSTQVLVASVRTSNHVAQAALLGAHAATCPPAIIYELVKHPLTDAGLRKFLDDWNNANKKI